MDDFLRKVVEGIGISPPENCQQSFKQIFEDAIHVEWFKRESHYEAVFYRNNLEHIALFSFGGVFEEYRLNIPSDHLPVLIKKLVSSKGEIMNSVLRNKGNMLEYEVIVRDAEFARSLISVSDNGSILEERAL